MKSKINFRFIFFLGSIFIELVIFLIVYFVTKDSHLVSNIFFGISVFFLVLLASQYFLFKRMIRENKKYELKINEYYDRNTKKLSQKKKWKKEKSFNKEDNLENQKNKTWNNVIFLIIPFLLAITIALIMAFI